MYIQSGKYWVVIYSVHSVNGAYHVPGTVLERGVLVNRTWLRDLKGLSSRGRRFGQFCLCYCCACCLEQMRGAWLSPCGSGEERCPRRRAVYAEALREATRKTPGARSSMCRCGCMCDHKTLKMLSTRLIFHQEARLCFRVTLNNW